MRSRLDSSIDPDVLSCGGHLTDPAGPAQADELAARLREAIALLPQQQAEVFCLHAFEELSDRQIARQLNITAGHVRVLLHRARVRLRELLAEEVETRP
jgi:RNA polymerase sigma-70 factor (ECF subfamily)